jgi:hypothetical protein
MVDKKSNHESSLKQEEDEKSTPRQEGWLIGKLAEIFKKSSH